MKLLANILGGFIGVFNLYFLYNNFLTKKKNIKNFIFLVYAFTMLYGMLYPMFAATHFTRLICTFIYLTFPLFLYKNKSSFKIVVIGIFYIITVFSEILIKSILLGFLGDFSLFYQAYEYNYFLGMIFSKLLTFCLIYFLTTFIKLSQQKLPIYLYFLLLFVPLSTVLLFYYLQDLVFQINEQFVYNAYCYITFMLLIFNLSVIFTISQVSQTSWLKARLNYEQTLVKEQQEYHQTLADYHQRIRQLYHDLHNHLLIIQHALQTENNEYALQYIEKQFHILAQNKATYTGILMLDTILDEKKQIALRQDTRYNLYSQLALEQNIKDETMQDFCLMLASCLDNALEATASISEKENRLIKISLKNDAQYLYCTIENTVQENVLLDSSELPKSSKADPLLHGLGLRHVKELAEKYDGHLFLACEDKRFITKFTISVSD